MNLKFIPFINSPKFASANQSTSFQPSQWRKDLETAFLASPEGSRLTAEINQIRTNKTNPNIYRCKYHYSTARHDKKKERQRLWLCYLEKEICQKLSAVIQQEPHDPDTLLVAALPEFFWRDINDNDKHDQLSISYIPGYGKPFYQSVFMDFLADNLSKDKPDTLRGLTQMYPNLIVFAGTFWWKTLMYRQCDQYTKLSGACPKESECKQDMEGEEKVYNSLPVFHSGELACIWNKQRISGIDGLGDGSNTHFRSKMAPLTNFTRVDGKPNNLPVVEFKGVSFGMDICLDFHCDEHGTGQSLSKSLLSAESSQPNVQVLIAGGMPLTTARCTEQEMESKYFYAQKLLLRCDAIADAAGGYADIWTPATGTNPVFRQSKNAPVTGYPFAAFAPIQLN